MDIKSFKKLSEEEMSLMMADMSDDDLDSLREEMREYDEKQELMLDAIGRKFAEMRAEAIDDRKRSGIEEIWAEDEEYYEGIDDVNRHESRSSDSTKPPGKSEVDTDEGTSSTIFVNITGPYCDAAAASLSDKLLPTDDSAWQILPTPVPELIGFEKGKLPDYIKQSIAAETQGDPELAQATEQKVLDKAQQILKEAGEKATKAQRRIEDWHVESQFHSEVRKVIEDMAKVGSGVIKGPIPQRRRNMAYKDGEIIFQEEIKPGSKQISYRNLYPAKGCGENIHDGSHIFERDDISSKKLRELKGTPGYIDSQIDAVLEEGPTEAKEVVAEVTDMKRDTKGLYEIWYCYGEMSKEEYLCACEHGVTEVDEDDLSEVVFVQITMVNNRVIKAVFNPLDSGDFPYDVVTWKRRRGSPWGIGVARLIRTAQRMLNGAARNLMDNAGLAGGPMIIIDDNIIEPVDGPCEVAPRKMYRPGPDAAPGADLSKAITYVKLDMFVNELQTIMYFALKVAEDVTGLPMLLQGQMGAQSPETLGQTQIVNNNASVVLRRIAKNFDDQLTEPHIRRYYQYHLQYGEDDEKGEFVIDARGSSNLVDRAIEKEKLQGYLQMSLNPIFGKDPKKVINEILKADNFDPKRFDYDDEEWKQIVENMSQPQQAPDPRVEIEQMRSELKQAEMQFKGQIEQMKIQSKEGQVAAEIQSKERIAQYQGELDQILAEMRHVGNKDTQFDALKTRLAETTMKLATTKQLAGMKATADQLPTPPVEPPGRADDGESYAA